MQELARELTELSPVVKTYDSICKQKHKPRKQLLQMQKSTEPPYHYELRYPDLPPHVDIAFKVLYDYVVGEATTSEDETVVARLLSNLSDDERQLVVLLAQSAGDGPLNNEVYLPDGEYAGEELVFVIEPSYWEKSDLEMMECILILSEKAGFEHSFRS